MTKKVAEKEQKPEVFLNKWQEYFYHLPKSETLEFREIIIKELEISRSAFYDYMRKVWKLKKPQKEAIAKVYGMPVHFLFPELETINN